MKSLQSVVGMQGVTQRELRGLQMQVRSNPGRSILGPVPIVVVSDASNLGRSGLFRVGVTTRDSSNLGRRISCWDYWSEWRVNGTNLCRTPAGVSSHPICFQRYILLETFETSFN